jgi:acyl carrier protein
MGLLTRIFRKSPVDEVLRKQANLWAARYYPGPERVVAATTARLVVEQQDVGFEQLSPETRFIEDLQMRDPLEGVELVMAVEGEFGIEIPKELAEAVETLGDLVSYLHERVQEQMA